MTAKTRAAAKPAVKNADTSTEQSTTTSQEQSTATGTEQNTATGPKQGDGDGTVTGGDGTATGDKVDGEGDSQSQGAGPAATSETAPQGMVTVTLKTSFYCHGKSASFTAGDEYECDAETADRLISNNMAKR